MSYGKPHTWLQLQHLHKLPPEKERMGELGKGENEPRFAWQTPRRSFSHRKRKTEIKHNPFCNKSAYGT